jgi:hypothetical protein
VGKISKTLDSLFYLFREYVTHKYSQFFECYAPKYGKTKNSSVASERFKNNKKTKFKDIYIQHTYN